MDNLSIQAFQIATKIIENQLAVKPGEEVLICTDPATDVRMVNALAAAVEQINAEYTVAMMPIRDKSKATTITKAVESAMESSDVYIGMTRASGAAVYNSKLKELLNQKRLRECSMVLRSFEHFIGSAAHADYDSLYEQGKKLAAKWKGKRDCHLTTSLGTDLVAQMISDEPIIECGIAKEPGQSMAFADGEVSLGPVEKSMEGTMVVDGPICYFGKPSVPIKLKISKGEVADIISGDREISGELNKMFSTIENSRNIAEIGIGLNPMSELNGDFEEEKKALGTMHLAFGNGIYYGQTVESQVHVDAVIYQPRIEFDGELIAENGDVKI